MRKWVFKVPGDLIPMNVVIRDRPKLKVIINGNELNVKFELGFYLENVIHSDIIYTFDASLASMADNNPKKPFVWLDREVYREARTELLKIWEELNADPSAKRPPSRVVLDVATGGS
jgi:hypothetical protein